MLLRRWHMMSQRLPADTHRLVLLALRVFLGGIFLFAGITKLASPFEFADQVRAYDMIGDRGSEWVAAVVPWTEVVVGTCLWLDVTVRGAFLFAGGLGSIFTVAVTVALVRQLKITCGCFGTSGEDPITWLSVFRPLAVVICSAAGLAAAWGPSVPILVKLHDEPRERAPMPTV